MSEGAGGSARLAVAHPTVVGAERSGAAPSIGCFSSGGMAQQSSRCGVRGLPAGERIELPVWWPWCPCLPRVGKKELAEWVWVPMVMRRCSQDHINPEWRRRAFFCCPKDPHPKKEPIIKHRWLWVSDLDVRKPDDLRQDRIRAAAKHGGSIVGVMSERPANLGDVGVKETPEEIGSFLRRLAAGTEAHEDELPQPVGTGLIAAMAHASRRDKAVAAAAAAAASEARTAKRPSVVQQLSTHRSRRT